MQYGSFLNGWMTGDNTGLFTPTYAGSDVGSSGVAATATQGGQGGMGGALGNSGLGMNLNTMNLVVI